jgi:hypothetical protein
MVFFHKILKLNLRPAFMWVTCVPCWNGSDAGPHFNIITDRSIVV